MEVAQVYNLQQHEEDQIKKVFIVPNFVHTDLGPAAIVPLPPHGARGGGEVGEDALGPHSLKVLRVGHHLAEKSVMGS